ncbi:MAG: hypothetical protein NTW86_25355 [Candidatus Sumerlaeota bacterium]|nr:hypothetical protein [Candidatus Sumerlaeota bacterium]
MSGIAMPKTWAALTRLRPLRPIHDETDYAKAMDLVGRLMGWDEKTMTRDQSDYLDSLVSLIETYEARVLSAHNELLRPFPPLERLKFLMEQHGMNASDLGRLLGCRTHGAAIVRGDRQLSKANILRLAEHFGVNPGFLLEAPKARPRARRKAGAASLSAVTGK